MKARCSRVHVPLVYLCPKRKCIFGFGMVSCRLSSAYDAYTCRFRVLVKLKRKFDFRFMA